MKRIETFLAPAIVVLAAAMPAIAQDEDEPRWFGDAYDNRVTLLYGVPDSDYVMLHFSCAIGKPVVSVNVQDEESTAEEGDLLHVSLSAGGERIGFSEKAVPNEDSGGADVHGRLSLDDAMRRILTATDRLEIVVDGHAQSYDMKGAAKPAAAMLAACDAPRPENDLDVTVTNGASLPLESLAWSEAGVDSFDSDGFGYEPLEPGASRAFTIPGGRDICTFDIAVLFADEGEDDEECCREPQPAGTQDLCENGEFVVHD